MNAQIDRKYEAGELGIERQSTRLGIAPVGMSKVEEPGVGAPDPSRPTPLPTSPEQEVAVVHPATTPPATPSGPADQPPLTGRQAAVLAAITSYVAANGYPPAMRELGAITGLSSASSVSFQLDALCRKGYIRRDPRRPRAIVITIPTSPVEQ